MLNISILAIAGSLSSPWGNSGFGWVSFGAGTNSLLILLFQQCLGSLGWDFAVDKDAIRVVEV